VFLIASVLFITLIGNPPNGIVVKYSTYVLKKYMVQLIRMCC